MIVFSIPYIILLFFISLGPSFASNINYVVTVNNKELYRNAYSYAALNITSKIDEPEAAYIEVPKYISNEPQVQRVFEPSLGGKYSKGTRNFEVFFPLTENISTLNLKIYPSGTDPTKIDDNTPAYTYLLDVSQRKDGSALMLYQEDKEKNVRVYTTRQVAKEMPSVEYSWYGTILPNATDKIDKAIVHLTEEKTSNLIDTASFSVAGKKIFPYKDPANGDKKHLYFFTNKDGIAKISINPAAKVTSARLVYWPFSNTSSESARIVVYDDEKFGEGLQVPIPLANPVIVSDTPELDRFSFEIPNDRYPRRIRRGGYLYILVNGDYKKTIPSSSNNRITFDIDGINLGSSKSDRPEANNVSYIYIDKYGNVRPSRKRAFFAFSKK